MKGSDVYVVIRGTQTTLEWLDDVTIQAQIFDPTNPNWGKTTKGFGGIHSQILPQIIASLEAIQNAGNNLGFVYITGHSLGAALAHLVAAGIYLRFGIDQHPTHFVVPEQGIRSSLSLTKPLRCPLGVFLIRRTLCLTYL